MPTLICNTRLARLKGFVVNTLLLFTLLWTWFCNQICTWYKVLARNENFQVVSGGNQIKTHLSAVHCTVSMRHTLRQHGIRGLWLSCNLEYFLTYSCFADYIIQLCSRIPYSRIKPVFRAYTRIQIQKLQDTWRHGIRWLWLSYARILAFRFQIIVRCGT